LTDLRALGIRVVLGSAVNPEVLRQARVGHANLMVTLTASEETNLEAALTAAGQKHSKSLKLLVHASRTFAELFETQPPFARIQAGLRARFFDDETIAARLLVQEFPVKLEGNSGGLQPPPRLLLVGDGTILVELLGAALTHYQFPGPELPEITVVTPAKNTFLRRFPAGLEQLDLVTKIKIIEVAAEAVGRLNAATIGVINPDLVFVGFQTDMAGLNAARSLAQLPDWAGAEIVLCVKPSTNIPRLLYAKEIAGRVKIRNVVEVGCSAEMVVRESLDGDARKIHERYVAAQKARGGTAATNPALVAWEELPESLRRASRSQADHNTVKRRTLIRSNSVETVEALSEAEHRRWMADRLLAGWQHGVVRDNARKLHPSIKPYSQLSESEKQKDRDTVLAVVKGLKG
jgi:hypothetical protein